MELLIHIYFVNMFNTKEIFFKKNILVLDENEVAIDRLKEDDLLIVIGVEEDALSKQSSRCLRKLLRNQGNKLLLSTQLIDQTMLKSFEGILLVIYRSFRNERKKTSFSLFNRYVGITLL